LHAEPELVVNAERSPPLGTVLAGSGPSQGFDFRMPVEYAVGDAVDPIPPVPDLAIGHVGKMRPQRPTQGAEHLLDGVERNASDQQKFAPHADHPQSWRVARAAPSTSASSLAQAICGWTRPPRPQSVDAITRSRPTRFAKRTIRSATSSGCSTTFVAWL